MREADATTGVFHNAIAFLGEMRLHQSTSPSSARGGLPRSICVGLVPVGEALEIQ